MLTWNLHSINSQRKLHFPWVTKENSLALLIVILTILEFFPLSCVRKFRHHLCSGHCIPEILDLSNLIEIMIWEVRFSSGSLNRRNNFLRIRVLEQLKSNSHSGASVARTQKINLILKN